MQEDGAEESGQEEIAVKLKNVLIVVKDIERAVAFYRDLFGLQVIQDAAIWKKFTGKDIVPENNACELYFEEKNIEAFARKLEESGYEIEYVNRLMVHSWGQKVIRFYDLDGNLIEVGTPV